ncbi:hypothetical protein LPH50_00665 [Xylella taiwanensis]|uniref:Uncharacterized protein n=1 Tax=Xylella taiwanensis TaxID=1444770 RepID=A0ABS8TVI8_9GAMM|nr:hypothetical protein [Xylella taiwanensis]MCD8459164.1 hypothetical protein [Xylella taiwanensis]MCD8461944.1 hypothetical protein [Xylella taiwanensis]MCD8464252.1 hypothetical protein [Xylella taiwanensis]MCD8465807.1 hypothetical protein [Xylella taiwanensis]MCD8466635.1 hypothetical protein [Xylella taiwanensis]
MMQRVGVGGPMPYMLTVAICFMRGSIFAALIAKLPLPQNTEQTNTMTVDI